MIESIKDLEKLLKVCRKQGVTKIKFDNVELELGAAPRDATESGEIEDNPYKGFPSGELSPEQLMFYSSGGLPQDDPLIKQEVG